MIKILPIDEPGFLQAVIRMILVGDSDIKLLPSLGYDSFSIETIEQLQPDLITIAIEEANRGVADIIKRVMDYSPLPIILHSESDVDKQSRFLKSLEYGAVDYFGWPTFQNTIKIGKSHEMFLEKIHYWGSRGLPAYYKQSNNLLDVAKLNNSGLESIKTDHKPYDLIVIGVSTGGVGVLSSLLKSIGDVHAPIVVALQMDDSVSTPLIEQLSEETGKNIKVGVTGQVIKDDSITFIPASVDGVLKKNCSNQLVFNTIFQPGITVHPSINQLFVSAASQAENPVGVLLSGHGDDGIKGSLAFTEEGFTVLVQDPESCLVNEMTSAVVKANAEAQNLSVAQIAAYLGSSR
ncbi:MAG: hypothetical protein HQL69_02700 [Magnetococcales bacterium]|nr:hypothetical protein [Magnetococcales bacterium]